jgi:hypothetical protein
VCLASLFDCSNSSALFAAENIPMDDGDAAPLSVHRRIPLRVCPCGRPVSCSLNSCPCLSVCPACVVQSKALAATEACHLVATASISLNRTVRLE